MPKHNRTNIPKKNKKSQGISVGFLKTLKPNTQKKEKSQDIKTQAHTIDEILDCIQALMALEFKPTYIQDGFIQSPFFKTLAQKQIHIFINEAKDILRDLKKTLKQ